MSTKINILNATEKFNSVLALLEMQSQNALVDIHKYIRLPKLDVVISPCSKEYKTQSGIMGCVTTPYLIDIMLDTDREDLDDLIINNLSAVIAHEIHHAVRASSGVEDKTLFQMLITEGLACHFETKFNGNNVPLFFDEIKTFEWRELYIQMQSQFNDVDYNYPVYFGGKDKTKFPNHAGYWVGFNLVSAYIKTNGGCAATLFDLPAEDMVVV